MANQPTSSSKYKSGHESQGLQHHDQSQNCHQPSTTKADPSQLVASTVDSVSAGSTANPASTDSSVVAWVLSDERTCGPFTAVAEIIGTVPTYVTGNHTAEATMTTMARQGSTGSDDEGEDNDDESSEKIAKDEKGEEKKQSKSA